jgi:hypothetical protein
MKTLKDKIVNYKHLNSETDKEIDRILSKICIKGYYDVYEQKKDDNEYLSIMSYESYNLITPNIKNKHLLTDKGRKVCSDGGWLKHLEKLQVEDENHSKKLIYDTKLAKWQAKTFWWFFGIAVIGGGLGLASFIWQILDKN